MIAAVNRLFAGRNDPFISDAIPFEPVKAKDAGSKQLLAPGADSATLQLRLLKEDPDKGLNKTQARKLLAEDAAAEIVRLLNAANRGECRLSGSEQPLRARDIAILVRDRNEAAVMQQALNSRQIGAVFLSRDSVMVTEEAREIALILKALASPRDERAIRSALACRLLASAPIRSMSSTNLRHCAPRCSIPSCRCMSSGAAAASCRRCSISLITGNCWNGSAERPTPSGVLPIFAIWRNCCSKNPPNSKE